MSFKYNSAMRIEVDDKKNDKPVEHTFDKSEIIVGRGKDCDLRIIADGISRQHVKISKEGDKVVIQDLGSSNGTFINEKRIDKEEFTTFFPAMLGYGVVLTLLDI